MEVTPVIEAEELYRFYHVGEDEIRALRGVSLRVDPGEIVAIAGPSGAANLLCWLVSQVWTILTEAACNSGGSVCPVVPKRNALFYGPRILASSCNRQPVRSFECGRHIRLGQRLAGKPDERRLDTLIEQFGLERRKSARPVHLSGGEAARAGLAVALAPHPPYL